MKIAEQVTFGGSMLDRAAELRSDIPALAAAMQDTRSHTVLIWRGKLLIKGEAGFDLVRLPLDHPVLSHATSAPILLGREDGAAIFAHDISGWQPDGLEDGQLGGFVDTTEQTHPGLPEGQRFRELRSMLTRLNARDAELATTAKAIFNWHASHGFCARCGVQSQSHNAGWERICPACGAHHFPRTDPVVIMLITQGNRCLLGRSHGWPEGMYSCLAGFVEPGEPIEAAVRREVMEEAGIDVGPVRYLSSQPWAFPSSLMFGCHGEALSEDIKVDPVELDDARWVSREQLTDVFAGLRTDILPARKGAIAHFLLRNWLADRLD
ncbi:NAD(+) diphosphatase [Primorskyibacter sp. 2E233]|uniref:NAD(+) diphosphatase n=1 Tax=Primorskyibacter sp. 2E233 TaxID=3413431 RepID=UPI003BF41C7B